MALAKRQKKAEAGAPLWMVTYGDLVTLLLTFFVLLLSMSEIKREIRVVEFMKIVREAFGYQSDLKPLPVDPRLKQPTNIELTTMLVVPIEMNNFSKSDDEGVQGLAERVRPLKDRERFVVGAPIAFEDRSAELTDDARQILSEFAGKLRGFNTQIEVRGHTSERPLVDTEWETHADLAFARARVVQQYLVEEGINPRRIVPVAAGINEPLAPRAVYEHQHTSNDIVEVLQLDTVKRAE